MKNILIYNDISGLGNCSMAANLPIFTKLGHYCMPIVTASYSCQTGFGNFAAQRNSEIVQFSDRLLANRIPDAIYVGFGNDGEVLQGVTSVVSRFPSKEVCKLVDPIMGDNGKLYPVFDDAYLQNMKRLVTLADCITPNLTEACLLAGINYAELVNRSNEPTFLATCGEVFTDFLTKTGAKSAVITGIECGKLLGNVVLDGNNRYFVTNERVEVTYSGTGDVFSSVVLGELLNGHSLLTATQVAANFVEKAARATTCSDRRFGVEFAKVIDLL
ncbi:MAG: bifunctional hydroxymethylpyrimidine kinase/phosphomethylpyrimidine kinase [Clostridiales bacterium]|nr:bifunctional hydroxymethylpyrimidine kinase/phosphomethylpyrimidine kinase [Clostridiales bacterium]